MRSQEEIIARIKGVQPQDPFGFEWPEYVGALTKESLEGLRGVVLKEDADLADYTVEFPDEDAIRARCISYMDFAWEKANNGRGLSASRTMAHYKAWLWLLGEDGFEDIETYEFYGKDHLVRICKFLDLDSKKWDDGRRVNSDSE